LQKSSRNERGVNILLNDEKKGLPKEVIMKIANFFLTANRLELDFRKGFAQNGRINKMQAL
jgi:hypothetical protein